MEQSRPVIKNSWNLLLERTSTLPIVTFCEKLDNELGGGVYLGQITELVGAASLGKTQFCFQLAVDVQLPVEFGGIGGHCVYVDTECCYVPKRVEEIANAAIQHCLSIASQSSELSAAAEKFTLDSILKGIYVKRCFDLGSLAATIGDLEKFVAIRPKVKLVIIDSFAFHFRDDQYPEDERQRTLLRAIRSLVKVATKYKIAVVAVNQVTTRIDGDCRGLVDPALSEILTRNAGDQILLGWKNRTGECSEDEPNCDRFAWLCKSSRKDGTAGVAPFEICADGVRDLAN